MNNKNTQQGHQAIVGLLLLIIVYSLILPYSFFKPISISQERCAHDQLYPVLDFSLSNSFYLPEKEANVVQVNILAFAAELVSFAFQNTMQALQLNTPKFPKQSNPLYFTKIPTYLKKCLLRI